MKFPSFPPDKELEVINVSLGSVLLSAATAARAVTKNSQSWYDWLIPGRKEPKAETKAGAVDGLVGCTGGHDTVDIGDDGDVYDTGDERHDSGDGNDVGDARQDDGDAYDTYLDYVDLQFEVETHPDLDVLDPLDTPPELDTLDTLDIHDKDTEEIKDSETDGDIEEDEWQLPACWQDPDFGKPCEVGIGECQNFGVLICNEDMTDLVCSTTAFPPQPETCDGKDNNCSGFIDDGNICFTPYYCDSDNDSFISFAISNTCNEYQCVPDDCVTLPGQDCDDNNEFINPFTIELCNNQDDNCNGVIDEGYPVGDECIVGMGECEQTGNLVCDPELGDVVCDKQPLPAQDEVCDGKDNNCNGQIDDGISCASYDYYCDTDNDSFLSPTISGSTDSLETIPENCNLNPGQDCDDANFNINPLAQEICNNEDENCNGIIDEMPPQDYYPADPATLGVGECKVGMQVCVNGEMQVVIPPVVPTDEVCNNKDDDCDDKTDEPEDTTQITSSGFDGIGICQPEIKVCENGILKIEQPLVTPQFETCDGLDNDCDDVEDNEGVCLETYYCDEDEDGFFSQVPSGTCDYFNCISLDHPACIGFQGLDCDDTNPDVYPAAPPGQCIDVDFNCDGQVSFAKLTEEIRLSNDPAESWDPSVATNGEVFFVTWKDNREGSYNGYYAMVANDGTILVPETAFTTGASVGYGPKVEWNGSEFLVVWKNDNYSLQPDTYCFPELMFTKFDTNGTKISEDVQITTSGSCSSLHFFDTQWCQDSLAIIFRDMPSINLVKVNSNGTKISNISVVSDNNPNDWPMSLSLSCQNNGYGIAFEDHRDDPEGISVGEIYYATANLDGNKIGNDLRVTNNSDGGSEQNEDYYPAITCHDDECGIIWTGENWWRATKFIRAHSNGSDVIGQEKILAQSEWYTYPKIIWDGQQYVATWTVQTPNAGTKQNIYLAGLDVEGNTNNITDIINYPNDASTRPSIVYDENNHAIGLGWSDGRNHIPDVDTNWETYFSIIGCQ